MSPERKGELLALMEDVTHREIKRLVAEFQSGRAEAAPISERLAALGEITACIHTAYAVLSGEVFAKVIARKVRPCTHEGESVGEPCEQCGEINR